MGVAIGGVGIEADVSETTMHGRVDGHHQDEFVRFDGSPLVVEIRECEQSDHAHSLIQRNGRRPNQSAARRQNQSDSALV